MADYVTTARPYAQAVFQLAQETRTQDLWDKRLQRLAAIAEDERIRRLIDDPRLSGSQLAGIFLSLTGEAEDRELASFVSLLAENRRFHSLPEMLKLFERLKRIEEGVRPVVISTAYPLDGKQLESLVGQLEPYFGYKLLPTVAVDPALIGGIKISFTDRVIDASVRGKLGAMAAWLKT